MKSVVALMAALVTFAVGSQVASAATSPNPGAQNTVLNGTFNDGGVSCTFQIQYGNAWATPYAKISLSGAGCDTAYAVQTSYLNGSYNQGIGSTATSGSGWHQATGAVYYSLLTADFRIYNDAGYLYCLTYNAVSNARTDNRVITGSLC